MSVDDHRPIDATDVVERDYFAHLAAGRMSSADEALMALRRLDPERAAFAKVAPRAGVRS